MKITTLVVGQMATNCYLVTDEDTQKTYVIDPGEEGDFISTTILENRLVPVGIILTHGHFDHCLAALDLKLNFNLPIHLHSKDLFLYEKAHLSAKHFSGISVPKLPTIDHFLSDSQTLLFGDSALKVLHTPGHTPGSCCLLSLPSTKHQSPSTSHLFTGDTLFAEGIGSTDHSYSSKPDLQKSLNKIKTEIRDLKSEICIYPGHEDYEVMVS